MQLRGWTFAVIASSLLATVALRADEDMASAGDTRTGNGEYEMLGPLRIRDMTPFNLLRLDMLPAHAVEAGRGSWAIEADLSFSNTFVMSDNVYSYLGARGGRAPLTEKDAAAILAMGQDAFYVDGEFGLLEVTAHYGLAPRTSAYLTLSAYDFSGGFMDGAIEGFHNEFGLGNEGRQFVAPQHFQSVVSIAGIRMASLRAPADGLGDPVVGLRRDFPMGASRWNLVLSGEAKIAWGGERLFLSTGTNDYGLQTSLQGKFRRNAVYFSASLVSTDGKVFGVPLERRVVPTLTAACEYGLTPQTNFVAQFYASQSTVRDGSLAIIEANKYQGSLGVRSHRGSIIYGIAVTENIVNFENTPDVGLSLTLAWANLKN
jgi:hypothetical protein